MEKDAYDHIAATYYLLAERRLRRKQQEVQNSMAISHLRKHVSPHDGQKPHLEPLALSPRYVNDITPVQDSLTIFSYNLLYL